MKTCTKCGKTKPRSEFYKQKQGKDGLKADCKICHSIWHKKYHQKNRERENANNKKWRDNNIEKDRAVKRAYTKSIPGIHSQIKFRAKEREQIFTVTVEEFTTWYQSTPDVCLYCGFTHKELLNIGPKYIGNTTRLTIDRMVNEQGYTLGNLAKACIFCNKIKGDLFTYDDMKAIGKIIRQRLLERVAENFTELLTRDVLKG